MAKKRIQKNFHASKQYRQFEYDFTKTYSQNNVDEKASKTRPYCFFCIQSYFKCHVTSFDRHDKLVVAQVFTIRYSPKTITKSKRKKNHDTKKFDNFNPKSYPNNSKPDPLLIQMAVEPVRG